MDEAITAGLAVPETLDLYELESSSDLQLGINIICQLPNFAKSSFRTTNGDQSKSRDISVASRISCPIQDVKQDLGKRYSHWPASGRSRYISLLVKNKRNTMQAHVRDLYGIRQAEASPNGDITITTSQPCGSRSQGRSARPHQLSAPFLADSSERVLVPNIFASHREPAPAPKVSMGW